MKKRYMPQKFNKKGFTLVELVVVIAIVAILMSITIPVSMAYINAAKKQGNKLESSTIADNVTTCLSKPDNIKAIQAANDKDKEDMRVEQVRKYLKDKDSDSYDKLNVIVVSDVALKKINRFIAPLPNDISATGNTWIELLRELGVENKRTEYEKSCCFVYLSTKSNELEVVKYHDGKKSTVHGENTRRSYYYKK